MIFDITLKENQFLVTIHKKFFEYETLPCFVGGNALTDKYSYCGIFTVNEKEFGFDGCLKQVSEDNLYRCFVFDFPKQKMEEKTFAKKSVLCVCGEEHLLFNKFLITIHLMHHCIVESMYYEKILFDTDAWTDQSLTFKMFFESGRCGHSIGGEVYEWTKKKLGGLSKESISGLQKYVHAEISRFHLYYTGEKTSFEQVTFSNDAWLIQCALDGRWVSWKASNKEKNDFSSHNMDFSSDQAVSFVGIVAMNTFLRNN